MLIVPRVATGFLKPGRGRADTWYGRDVTVLRQDATTNEWVIMAPERGRRPHEERPATRPSLPEHAADCPFCPGNEHLTPPEITRVPTDGPWEQRVFPNLFPALVPEGSTDRRGPPGEREMDGVGWHEVVVESPRHDERMDEMSTDRILSVLRLWRSRYVELRDRPSVKAVIVFKNFGERAGTSLVHPHSQILAVPVFPPDQLHRYQVATRYFDDTGHCAYVDLVQQMLRERTRLVAERGSLVAFAPFAAGLPYETWIAPVAHQTSFGQCPDGDLADLAVLLRDVLGALRRAAGDPDFNLVVDSAPAIEESKPFFLWHIRVLPRITTAAGFELGSGMSINPVLPEHAASILRGALAPAVP
jgi:UDPglucose--hexose-1-phosphate uridylyltransferase